MYLRRERCYQKEFFPQLTQYWGMSHKTICKFRSLHAPLISYFCLCLFPSSISIDIIYHPKVRLWSPRLLKEKIFRTPYSVSCNLEKVASLQKNIRELSFINIGNFLKSITAGQKVSRNGKFSRSATILEKNFIQSLAQVMGDIGLLLLQLETLATTLFCFVLKTSNFKEKLLSVNLYEMLGISQRKSWWIEVEL